MARICTILILLLNLSIALKGQDTATGVSIYGNIIDAKTRIPVKARITFESLPYGNYVGFFTDSILNFKFPAPARYMLFVDAEGYLPFQEILEVKGDEPLPINRSIQLQNPATQYISMDKLTFGLGKAVLSKASKEELDKVAYIFNKNDKILIHLEGHSDYHGNARQNMKLSEERVEMVKQYLVNRGVTEKRIKTAAFGGDQPIAHGNGPEVVRNNRRVEVKIYNYF